MYEYVYSRTLVSDPSVKKGNTLPILGQGSLLSISVVADSLGMWWFSGLEQVKGVTLPGFKAL